MNETTPLNTTNPDHLTYESGMIQITILGGIRLDSLDRMRVTLKIKVEEQSIRHNLDLYNDNQTEKLIRKVAERLDVGTSVTARVLMDLTDTLEGYRMAEFERIASADIRQKKLLTPAEIKAAQTYATTPNLMQRTGDDLQAIGIIGEWNNALTLKMVMSSHRCNDPLSAITLAKSGIGKSYLQEKVATTMPAEDIIESTQITESSFYRFGQYELVSKIFLIEDLEGAEGILYPLREMVSKKRLTKTIVLKDSKGESKTVTLKVEGPISVCGCTTKESIYEDNANRSLLLHLDNSKVQDERIMNYHRKVKAGLIDRDKEETIREQLEHVQRILKPIKIINPYAIHIDLPKEVFKPRRTLPLLLSFIEAITYYHQYQREELADQNGELYIETTLEDIEWGFKLLRDVLFRKSDELSGACREFYEALKNWTDKHKTTKFYGNKLREDQRIHPRTLNRYLHELTEFGRLQIIGGNKYKTGYEYEIMSLHNETLQDKIDQQIESVLNKLKQAHLERTTKVKRKKSA